MSEGTRQVVEPSGFNETARAEAAKEPDRVPGASRSIGIERYMEVRSASGPKYNHDGSKLYFFSNITGIPQVWVLEEGSPWPRQLTFFKDRVMQIGPSPVDDLLVLNGDLGGSENAQLFLTDAQGVELANLSDDNQHIYTFSSWTKDGKQFIYTSNKRNGKDFDIYRYDVESKEHEAIFVSNHTNHAGELHPSGGSILVHRSYTNLNHDLLLADLESGFTELLTPHEGEASFRDAQFSQDGQSIYLLTDKDSEFSRVARLDTRSKQIQFLTEDKWDAETLALSPSGEWLAFTVNEDGSSKLFIAKTPEASGSASDASMDSAPTQGIEIGFLPDVPQLQCGVIVDLAWSKASDELSMTVSSPSKATEVWTLWMEKKTLERRTFASISGVPEETFVEPELIHYSSFDGLTIPAFYYRPPSEGPYPVVVYVHGGPEGQSKNSFNSVIQYFVGRGYAVLAPNVRGSAGYGRTYIHLDDVRNRMHSVQDLAKSVEWLVKHGNARKDAIAVMGGSYGGFMVLAAVTHFPNLWAAGVDIVGIANLRTFIENTSPYRRHLREPEYGTVEADGEFFDEISPIHHVDKITAPMIVVHGKNDPRVPVGEAEQIVAALEARNHPVECLIFDDEGHGVVKLPNRIKAYSAIADFLDRHLKR